MRSGRLWPGRRRLSRRLAIGFLALLTVAFATLKWVLVPYRIAGPSMSPSLCGDETGGDIVLVNRLAYAFRSPARWDVVVFEPPPLAGEGSGNESVKRVVGLPGETVEVRDGQLLIDGSTVAFPEPIQGEYIIRKGGPGLKPLTLLPGEYFLLGDNSYFSRDSRRWGPVEREAVRGSVVLVVLPLGRLGKVP